MIKQETMAKYLTALLCIVLWSTLPLHAQIIDNYGVSAGLNVANQAWTMKKSPNYEDHLKPLLGPSIFLFADKEVNKWSSCRVQIGYMQKGYIYDGNLTDQNGSIAGKLSDKSMNLHLISFDLAMKFKPVYRVTPSPRRFKPFVVLGIRNDFRVGHGTMKIEANGKELKFTDNFIKDEEYIYNLGGTLGIGVSMWTNYSIEFEFNPTINNLFNSDFFQIREYCYGIRFGYTISEHFQK